jgi:hypothetical protein
MERAPRHEVVVLELDDVVAAGQVHVVITAQNEVCYGCVHVNARNAKVGVVLEPI